MTRFTTDPHEWDRSGGSWVRVERGGIAAPFDRIAAIFPSLDALKTRLIEEGFFQCDGGPDDADERFELLISEDGEGRENFEDGSMEIIPINVLPDCSPAMGSRSGGGQPDADLGRELSELIGAVGLYMGDLGWGHKDDKARLRRSMQRAMRSPAFVAYMQAKAEDDYDNAATAHLEEMRDPRS